MGRYRALRRSLSDFRLHPWLHLISISTITISLFILGVFLLFYRNFDYLAEKSSPKTTGTAYLRDNLPSAQLEALREKILSMEGVADVNHKSKEVVLNELQSFLGGVGKDTQPVNDLFPDILEIELVKEASPVTISNLKMALSKITELSELDFSEDWIAQYQKIRGILKTVGVFLILGIIFGCSFIISNFMGMRHQSRKTEIEVVRLMGAHRNFLLAPFLWEGFFEGVVGAIAALIGLYGLKSIIATVFSVKWVSLMGLQEWMYLSPMDVFMVLVCGVLMASLGGFTVFLRFHDSV